MKKQLQYLATGELVEYFADPPGLFTDEDIPPASEASPPVSVPSFTAPMFTIPPSSAPSTAAADEMPPNPIPPQPITTAAVAAQNTTTAAVNTLLQNMMGILQKQQGSSTPPSSQEPRLQLIPPNRVVLHPKRGRKQHFCRTDPATGRIFLGQSQQYPYIQLLGTDYISVVFGASPAQHVRFQRQVGT